jgi:hypothetical protein
LDHAELAPVGLLDVITWLPLRATHSEAEAQEMPDVDAGLTVTVFHVPGPPAGLVEVAICPLQPPKLDSLHPRSSSEAAQNELVGQDTPVKTTPTFGDPGLLADQLEAPAAGLVVVATVLSLSDPSWLSPTATHSDAEAQDTASKLLTSAT